MLLGLIAASALPAQTQPPSTVWRLPAGAPIIARLRTSIDTRYTIVKSSVVAVVIRDVKQHGHVLLPKGTQLLGRVLISHPAQKGQPAALQVQFQQALLADGNTLPLSAGISSVFTRARRAALDRSNGIGAPPAAPEGGPGMDRTPVPPSFHGPRQPAPGPQPPAAPPDFTGSPVAAQHAPAGELRDSDGVPLRIVSPPAGTGAEGETMLSGSGPTIRLNSGTKIEIQVRHSVPVPESTDH